MLNEIKIEVDICLLQFFFIYLPKIVALWLNLKLSLVLIKKEY